ncbi:MAG: hypothetical protein KAS23_12305 [Anaerohalosphaera sp.]|nr:hypothetical protein [Anaerohalosphaera sp.]
MNAAQHLEIAFQLVTNRQLHFTANSREHAEFIINSVNPQKFFTDHEMLKIFGHSSMSSISKEAISFMVFATPIKLDWPYPLHFKRADVLTREVFVKAVKSELPGISKLIASGQAGQDVCYFLDLSMQGGVHWYFRLHSETVTNMEKMHIAKVLSEVSGLHAVGANAAGVLINMKNVAAWTLYPGPVNYTKKDWMMTPAPREG